MSIFENLVGYWPLEKEIPGQDLFDPSECGFETDTGSVLAAGTNTIEASTDKAHSGSKCLKVTYVDNAVGAYIYFRDAFDLSQNLVIGKKYRVTWWGAMDAGDSWNWNLHDGVSSVWTSVETSETLVKYEQDFIAQSATEAHLKLGNMSAGEIAFLDDITLQELYTPNLVGTEHGTVNGATRLALGKGYEFDGLDDFIGCGNDASLQIAGPLTIMVLVNPDAIAGTDYIISKGGWNIWADGTMVPTFETRNAADSGWDTNAVGPALVVGERAWVTAVYDVGAQTKVVYKNKIPGAAVSKTDGAISRVTAFDFELGRYANGGTQPFAGDENEVVIYNRALTQREIHQVTDGRLRERYYEEIYKDITQSQARAIAQGH